MLASGLQLISLGRVLKWMTFHHSRSIFQFQPPLVLESKVRSGRYKNVGGVYPGKQLSSGHFSRRRNNRLAYISGVFHTPGESKLIHHVVSGKVGIEHSQGLSLDN